MYSETESEPFLKDEVRDYLAENPHTASAYKAPQGSIISEEEEYKQLMEKLREDLPKKPYKQIRINREFRPSEFEDKHLAMTVFDPSYDYFEEYKNTSETLMSMQEKYNIDKRHLKKYFVILNIDYSLNEFLRYFYKKYNASSNSEPNTFVK